jgi:hypothetical protein
MKSILRRLISQAGGDPPLAAQCLDHLKTVSDAAFQPPVRRDVRTICSDAIF